MLMKSFDRFEIYTITTATHLHEISPFDIFHNTEQFRGNYAKITTDCVMKEYGTPTATTQG